MITTTLPILVKLPTLLQQAKEDLDMMNPCHQKTELQYLMGSGFVVTVQA